VAAEVFRYKVTGTNQAKASAWELFRGMQFLYNVSDICVALKYTYIGYVVIYFADKRGKWVL